MTQDIDKKIRVELEHENKVIRLDALFYDLKGVLICEATEEERKKYHCGKYMTYPIVEDDWEVHEESCIAGGIGRLVVGKRGDTILWDNSALIDAIRYNADHHRGSYQELLLDLKQKGITISTKKSLDSDEEWSDVIGLVLTKCGGYYRIESNENGFYIPERLFYIGEDDELYQMTGSALDGFEYTKRSLVEEIADDVYELSFYFDKPNLQVYVATLDDAIPAHFQAEIPKDWFYTLHTLEADINRRVKELRMDYPWHVKGAQS